MKVTLRRKEWLRVIGVLVQTNDSCCHACGVSYEPYSFENSPTYGHDADSECIVNRIRCTKLSEAGMKVEASHEELGIILKNFVQFGWDIADVVKCGACKSKYTHLVAFGLFRHACPEVCVADRLRVLYQKI